MESKWEISFEDIVYLIISAGLFCLIISWMLSVLVISTESYNYEILNTPSSGSVSESLAQQAIENQAPPIVSQQFTQTLNIHPLKVLRIHNNPDTPLASSHTSCTQGDC